MVNWLTRFTKSSGHISTKSIFHGHYRRGDLALTRRIRAIALLIILVAIIGLSGFIYFKRFSTYPESQATLYVTSGTAEITRTGAAPVEVNAGQDHAVKAGDNIKSSGWARLALAGAAVDVTPG